MSIIVQTSKSWVFKLQEIGSCLLKNEQDSIQLLSNFQSSMASILVHLWLAPPRRGVGKINESEGGSFIPEASRARCGGIPRKTTQPTRDPTEKHLLPAPSTKNVGYIIYKRLGM